MNLAKLKYFVAVVDEMNISRAAKKLFISQQSLSSQINALESEIGFRLFVRKPHLELTSAGVYFEHFARQVLLLQSQLEYDLRQIGRQKEILTICIGPIRSKYYLPTILPIFYEQYPYAEVKVITGTDSELNAIMSRYEADIYIGSGATMSPALVQIPLCQECFHLIASNKMIQYLFPANYHKMIIDFRDGVDITKFKDANFLLPPSSDYRKVLDEYFLRHGITPKVITESNNNELLTSLSINNVGVSFSIEPHAHIWQDNPPAGANNRIHAFPIRDLSYTVAVSHLPNRELSEIAKNFIAITKLFIDRTE